MKFQAFLLLSGITSAFSATLLWSDEFDNSMSYELDEQYWDYDLGTGANGWGNGELQMYTRDNSNVRVEDGNLIIQAHKRTAEDGSVEFTSARVNTMGKVAFKYGTLAAKIQMPDTVSGLWPAFWLMGDVDRDWPDCGEVDIAELGWRGRDNRKVYSGAHWVHNGTYALHDASADFPTDLNGAWHIYRLEWNSSFIETFVDDMSVMKLDIGPACSDCEEFHWEHGILLNLAVGGAFTTDQVTCGGSSSSSGSSGGCDFRGPEDITAPLPGNMAVDWIRLYDNGETEFIGAELSGTASTLSPTTSLAPVDEFFTPGPTPAITVGQPVALPDMNTPTPSMTSEPSLALSQEQITIFPTAPENEIFPTTPTAPVPPPVGDTAPVPAPIGEVLPTAPVAPPVGDGSPDPAPVGEVRPTAPTPVGDIPPVTAPVGEVRPTAPTGDGSLHDGGKGKGGKGGSKKKSKKSKSGKKSSKKSNESTFSTFTNAEGLGSGATSSLETLFSSFLVLAAVIMF